MNDRKFLQPSITSPTDLWFASWKLGRSGFTATRRIPGFTTEIAQRLLSDLCGKPSVGQDQITKQLKPAIMCRQSHEVALLL